MSMLSPILRKTGRGVAFWCPGCGESHRLNTEEDARPRWSWDGNVDAPTFSPSVLVRLSDPDGEIPDEVCHSFVRGGQIQFLSDSTHSLSGQTVPLPPWPEGLL